MSTSTTEPMTYRHPKKTLSDRITVSVAHIILTLWTLLVVLPLVWMVVTSFKSDVEITDSRLPLWALPTEWKWENYANAWGASDVNPTGLGPALLNTVIVVGFSLALTMILGSMVAYVLARFEFPGNRFIYYMLLFSLTFPIFMAVVPLVGILDGMGLGNSRPGLILVYVAFSMPFTAFFMFAFFKTLPNEIAEAAKIDGAGQWTTFFRIMLPMAAPGLASVTIFNFLGLWNQLLLPLTLNNNDRTQFVLSQAIYAFNGTAGYRSMFGVLFAGAVITVIPVLVFYVIFQRRLHGSVAQGTMK